MDVSFYRHPAGADNLLCFYGSFRKFHIKLYQRIRRICSHNIEIYQAGRYIDTYLSGMRISCRIYYIEKQKNQRANIAPRFNAPNVDEFFAKDLRVAQHT